MHSSSGIVVVVEAVAVIIPVVSITFFKSSLNYHLLYQISDIITTIIKVMIITFE